jgi:hypothetical protein
MNQSPQIEPTLINGIDEILKAVEDRRTKAADKWARGWPAGQGLGRLAMLYAKWTSISVGHLVVSSRVFSS